ncbi:MAG: formate dehydrogenase subunit delta [Pseudomonadota bacterium]
MSDGELEHLVQMANDIARNLAFNADAEARIAAHLQRFWAPVMRAMIRDHVRAGGAGLSDLAMAAVKQLPEPGGT